MSIRRRKRLVPIALALVVVSVIPAFTAGNVIPGSRAAQLAKPIATNDLKPAECAGISLTGRVSGSGTVTGGAASELITGSAAVDVINGAGGNDCILGGDGADAIDGGLLGTDVCIGGAGLDTFTNCEQQYQ